MKTKRTKLADVKPAWAWGWIYHEPHVLSAGGISSFKNHIPRTDAKQVPIVLLTDAAFAKMKRTIRRLTAERDHYVIRAE